MDQTAQRRPNEERMALTGAKRNVEAMQVVRDGLFRALGSGPAALLQR